MTRQTFSFTSYVYRGPCEREYEVEVTYSVTPGSPAILYGPCPQPADDGEVEIISATCEVDLTEEDYDRFYDDACDRADDDLAEYHAEAAEYRAEMIREERMLASASEATVPMVRAA